MADAPQTIPSQSIQTSAAGGDAPLDQLSKLHRMSRTAGLGSNEYSAVNIMAVVAVLIGAASSLALVDRIFLILPLLGVVFAAISVWQIRSSNGTQTGLPLAILALVLSVSLTGITGVRYIRSVNQQASDVRNIDELAGKFGQLISQKKYAEAYALTDVRFQEQVPLPRFEGLFDELAGAPGFGPLTAVRTTKLFAIEADPDTGLRMAVGKGLFETAQKNGDNAIGTEVRYRNTGDEWKIFSIPQFFPPKAAAAAPGAGGGAAGPAGPPEPSGPPAPR